MPILNTSRAHQARRFRLRSQRLKIEQAILEEKRKNPRSQEMRAAKEIEIPAKEAALDYDGAYSNSNTIVRANTGLGLHGLNDHKHLHEVSPDLRSTHPKISGRDQNDLLTTPVPRRGQYTRDPGPYQPIMSLPPAIPDEEPDPSGGTNLDGTEDVDRSPKSQIEINDKAFGLVPQIYPPFRQSPEDGLEELTPNRRPPIFDWSENQGHRHDHSSTMNSRPGISHGTQSNKLGSVKSASHLGNAVNQESTSDADIAPSLPKFATWGLGSRPVREEWDDDFEFDDFDEPDQSFKLSQEGQDSYRDSIRSVKVPQSIIDRQANVGLGLGQVRELMRLVAELKDLRMRGISSGLLESHSRQLWDDAESVINLVTMIEVEAGTPLPVSTVLSDFSDEDTSPKQLPEDPGHQTIHPNHIGLESPAEVVETKLGKDIMQEVPDLVVRAAAITRSLKEIVRKSEEVSLDAEKTPVKSEDLTFSQIIENPRQTAPRWSLNMQNVSDNRRDNEYVNPNQDGSYERFVRDWHGEWHNMKFSPLMRSFLTEAASSLPVKSESDNQQLESESDHDFVVPHETGLVVSWSPLVEVLSDNNNKSDNNHVNALASSSLIAANTTSLDRGVDSSDDIPNNVSGEISMNILANNRTGVSEETTDSPLPVVENGPEIGSDNSAGNTPDKKNEDFSDEPLADASEKIFPATIDETPHPIPSPLSVIYPGVHMPSQPTQPDQLWEMPNDGIAGRAHALMADAISDSDVINHSMSEVHESPLTILKSPGILKSVMNGLTHIPSILGSHLPGVGRQRSVRITWKCACGTPMYANIVELKPGAATRLQDSLRSSSRKCEDRIRQRAGATSSGGLSNNTVAPSSSSAPAAGNTATLPAPNAQGTLHNPSINNSLHPPGAAQPLLNSSTQERKYLLLCVALALESDLAQIELTAISNDEYMFNLIRTEIEAAQSSEHILLINLKKTLGAKALSFVKWLAPPKLSKIAGLDFVRFRVVPVREVTRPWNFTSPSLPPEQEIQKQNYIYAPCPADDYEISSLDHVMVHSLLTPGPHLDRFWLDQFPKKLKTPLSYNPSHPRANVAWGIRLRYGINWTAIVWILILVVAFSGVGAVVYSILLKDPSGAFQIAGYVVATVSLNVAYLQLKSVSPGG